MAMKGCLMPLGGAEHTSGYKGYGLAALVEIFCGISAGMAFCPLHMCPYKLLTTSVLHFQERRTDRI